MGEKVKIGKAKKKDIDEILSLTEKIWKGFTMAELLEKKYGQIGGKPWYEYKKEEIRKFCEEHLEWVFVAEINGKIVGYATYILDFERKIGIVGNNGAEPSHRGKGIGSALHKKVLQTLKNKGMEIALVSTLEIDIPAQNMYKKHGFEELTRTIHYSQKLK